MTTERGEPNMRSNIIFGRDLLFSLVIPIIAICFLSIIMGQAFAQEASQNYIIRRVEIWSLFYRGMTAAFVVGALVQGSIIYICWRFRESNKKNMPRESMEGVER